MLGAAPLTKQIMKAIKSIVTCVAIFLITSGYTQAQDLSTLFKKEKTDIDILWKSRQPVVASKNGKMIVSRKITPKSFKIYDTNTKIKSKKVKLPKGLEVHSQILSLNDKWVYINNLEKGSFSTGKYQIVELNENGSYAQKVDALECTEEIGNWKFQGLTSKSTMVPFDAKINKSKNEEFISIISSKYYGTYSRQVGMADLTEYRKTEEEFHFVVFNNKLDIQKKGSYKPGITRGDITGFNAFLRGNGDLILVYGVRQELESKSNRMLFIKISMEDESVERVTLNLPKFNLSSYGLNFNDDLIQITGYVDDVETNEVDFQGVFYSSVDNNLFKLKDVNVMLFSEPQKSKLNYLYEVDRDELSSWKSVNNEVFPQMRTYSVSKDDEVLGLMNKYYVKAMSKNALTSYFVGYSYSSHFYIRFSKDKKSIDEIVSMKTPSGFNQSQAALVVMKGNQYLCYSDEGYFKAVKIPELGEKWVKAKTVAHVPYKSKEKRAYSMNYRGYIFNEKTNTLTTGIEHVMWSDKSGYSTTYDRVAEINIKLP
jgi:hypothetical protein